MQGRAIVGVADAPIGAPAGTAPPVAEASYRPHLDGLRAVAVYLVVLFHAGLTRLEGGYIGVDVFFVLSGYLVTQLLLRDLGGGGSIRFGRFYARRFRRLLPAAFVALIGTALLVATLTPAKAVAAIGSFKAAFLYVANWYFIRESTSYFGAEVASNPVLPFWSLAVEEQFYLVWPLALAALFWLTRRAGARQVVVVRSLVALGGIASLLWALHLRIGDPNRAYFGTDARAYQLLAGASIALVPGLVRSIGGHRRVVGIAAPVALIGIIFLATSFARGDAILRGIGATVLTALAIVAFEGVDGGLAKWLLSTDLLVYLGRISYGTYLWHWPVILLATESLHLDPLGAAVVACLVATGLASLSFQLLERPVREAPLLDRHRRVVIGAGLAISVLSALVLIPAIIEPDAAPAIAAPTTGATFTPLPDWLDTAQVYRDGFGAPIAPDGSTLTCVGAPPERCTIVHGSGPHVLLMGDSTAEMMVPAFTKIAEEHDLTLSIAVNGGCPWQRDYYVMNKEIQDACRLIKEDAYNRVIPALDPDVIVVSATRDENDKGPTDPAQKPLSGRTEEATNASLDQLLADGRKVVVVEPIPVSPGTLNPLTCLTSATVVEDCRYLADTLDPTWYELLVRQRAADDDHVKTLDLDRLVCPYFPICDPIIGGTVVKWDGQHVTAAYSRSLAEPIAAALRADGLIPA